MMTDEELDELDRRLRRKAVTAHDEAEYLQHTNMRQAANVIRELRREVAALALDGIAWRGRALGAEQERDALAAWQACHLALHDEHSRSQQVNDGI